MEKRPWSEWGWRLEGEKERKTNLALEVRGKVREGAIHLRQ